MARILIVDDSKTSRRFFKNMLEGSGHEIVAEALNGQEGVELYEEYKPDLVTMDISMPVMDGIQATKEIIEKNPDAKIIMVSAAAQKSNMIEALKRGALDFIEKPFDADVIINCIDKIMND